MNKKRKAIYRIIIGIVVAAMLATAILAVTHVFGAEAKQEFFQPDLDQAVYIQIQDGDMTLPGGENKNVSYDGQTLEIDGAGTYVLSGNMTGKIKVSSSKSEEVVLVLEGLTVENPEDAAIEVKKTGSLVIYLPEGVENTLTSGAYVELEETTADELGDASGGALYSKANTLITGTGTLNVNGYINNGIHVTKDLTLDQGTINVTAVNHGIRSKALLTVNQPDITVKAGNDGLKAEQEAQEAVEEVVDETTGEVLTEAQEAEEAAGDMVINGGNLQIDCYGDGLQSLLTMTLNGGNLVINAMEDALDCGEVMTVNGGNLTIRCGDDGIHADKELYILGGEIKMSTAYEGIEANQITIMGGDMQLITRDDGINANGGPQSFGGPGGSNGNAANDRITDMPNLVISGGTLYVNASGDGLDSNGNILISGGTVIVDGPVYDANGALDSGAENGGEILVNGGVVFAGGASGMAERFSNTSEQYSFLCYLPAAYQAETIIRVLDAEGTELFSHTAYSSGKSVVFSCPDLEEGQTYTLCIGSDTYDIPLTSVSTALRINADGSVTEGASPGGSRGGPGAPGGPGR